MRFRNPTYRYTVYVKKVWNPLPHVEELFINPKISKHFANVLGHSRTFVEITIYLIMGDVRKMAKKSFGSMEFINTRLTNEDSAKVVSFVKNSGYDPADFIEAMTSQGYKISFSYDLNHDCYIAAITGREGTGENENKCMTSRAGSWDEALCLCAYKHQVMFAASTWKSDERNADNWG